MSKRVRRDKTVVDCIDFCGSSKKTYQIQIRKPRKIKRSLFTQGNLFDPASYAPAAGQS